MHTDKYGRLWRYKPDHNPDMMVQVPHELMLNYIIADRMLTQGSAMGAKVFIDAFDRRRPDCYVLKMGDHLYTGARMSDEPSDYFSSCIHNKGSLDAMLWHISQCTGVPNMLAINELLGSLERPAQCW